MDYTGIASAVTASVGAVDSITKLIASVRDGLKSGKLTDADIKRLQEQVASLLDTALSAKAAQLQLQDLVFRLQAENEAQKSKIARMEAFDAEAGEYDLKPISPHSFGYFKKNTAEEMGKTPIYCVPCFDERRKSILQFAQVEHSFDVLKCPKCGTTVRAPADRGPPVVFSGHRQSIRGWDVFD